MKIKVLFFANIKEILGQSELEIELKSGTKVEQLTELLAEKGPNWARLFNNESIKVAVNHELVNPDQILKAADEVAYFPPVTGG
jgi:sulfur-carrier protein